jgi:beta-lactamase regulating signal transducer with metallopeptidase domain
MTWYECIADASVRAVALAAMAGILTFFLRRNAAAQHALWTLVVAGMLGLPVLHPVVPAAYVYEVERPAPKATIDRPAAQSANKADGASVAHPARTGPAPRPLPWAAYAAIVYIAGVVPFAVRLLAGLLTTRRLLRGARPIDLGVNADVEESDRVRVPVTVGLKRMHVLLPVEWREWPAEKMKVVLAHELAHARRCDPAINLLAAVNKCIFWFHPLAWWMERRLAVLAEHVADDAGLAVAANAESYARVVLEIASRMEGQGTRLIWNASAMNGQLVAHRIRRVMDSRTKPGAGRLGHLSRAALFSSAALLIWLSVALDLQSVSLAQAPSLATDWGTILDGWVSGPTPKTTAKQAAHLEQQLAANPEDEATRWVLLQYYSHREILARIHRRPVDVRMREQRIRLVLWLIDHHPESAIHAWDNTRISPDEDYGGSAAVFEDARSRWLAQVNLHPDDARVLGNAARALGEGSVPEQIDLMTRAQKLDPEHRTEPLAKLYSLLLLYCGKFSPPSKMNDPALAALVKINVRQSNDPVLVGAIARQFVEGGTPGQIGTVHIDQMPNYARDFTEIRTIETELVAHAQALEPGNPEWSHLMQHVRDLPIPAPEPELVRMGAEEAANMLQYSPPPVYPPLAKMARVQGVVKLQVRIGTHGQVAETTVLSGHPLLVPAAIDAVRLYVYKPLRIDDRRGVDVITTVEVPFGLGVE